MSSIQFEDITVIWGSQPDQMDVHMARWRQAVYQVLLYILYYMPFIHAFSIALLVIIINVQDLAVTNDGRFMYYLYDPVADETSGTR